MSAIPCFRLKCDGGCGRWLSEVTAAGLAKMTSVQVRAQIFSSQDKALRVSRFVGWTKCSCPEDIRLFGVGRESHLHTATCEIGQGLSLCGNCRAKKRS